MIVTNNETLQVSYVTNRVFGCHQVSGSIYEFLIQRSSNNNDYKGINDRMSDPNPS